MWWIWLFGVFCIRPGGKSFSSNIKSVFSIFSLEKLPRMWLSRLEEGNPMHKHKPFSRIQILHSYLPS